MIKKIWYFTTHVAVAHLVDHGDNLMNESFTTHVFFILVAHQNISEFIYTTVQ